MNEIRCDNATAGRPVVGCVVPWASELTYTKAQASGPPGATFANPLTRTENASVISNKRTRACGSAPSLTAKSCDEYPIATSQQELNSGGTRRTQTGCGFTGVPSPEPLSVVTDMVPLFINANPYGRGIVPNTQRLAQRLRAAGGIVAWVLPVRVDRTPVGDEFHGPKAAGMLRNAGGTGPLRDRLWHALTIGPDSLLVEKSALSAFFPGHSPLPELLQERGIDTVLITGTATNVCCESSARDAWTLGYRVIMVADANSTGCEGTDSPI
ncbi:cysteine hydrolase family protein [Streptomyces sp. CB00455]|uniref:cysteine hydrolase family protein n=1 Tax=Streptomyces sp. CB00455 TaxID=1703927 RepID=UPI000ABD4420|nr:isochorismatase family cysteine hydrolase [Streptomyces sp. CB00455]